VKLGSLPDCVKSPNIKSMKHPDAPPLPAWIMKKDGRILPFDEVHICRDLYQAGLRLGKADPFLARELTDASVFLLASENPGATLRQEDIVLSVSRTIREFGHADTALTYSEIAFKSGGDLSADAAISELFHKKDLKTPQEFNRDKMLRSVFSPDLSAGVEEGWFQVEGITFPDGLLSGTFIHEDWLDIAINSPEELSGSIKNLAAKIIHFEGADFLALEQVNFDIRRLEEILVFIDKALLETETLGILHLNVPHCPPWFHGLSVSPLFHSITPVGQKSNAYFTRAFLSAWIAVEPKRLKMHWHQFGELDGALKASLDHLARTRTQWAFSHKNKPRLDKQDEKSAPNVLDKIYLRLDRLANACIRKGILDKFTTRLPSLVRFGVAAGLQKRAFLRKIEAERRQNDETKVNLAAGFLLEKATLIIAPKGLPDLLENLFPGKSFLDQEVSQFVKNVLQVLNATVRQEESKGFLSIVVDLSHLLEVKESKIKVLMKSKQNSIKFNMPIDLQGKVEWLNGLISGEELLTVFATKEEVLEVGFKRGWTKVHSLEW